jgi:hypothetical protein
VLLSRNGYHQKDMAMLLQLLSTEKILVLYQGMTSLDLESEMVSYAMSETMQKIRDKFSFNFDSNLHNTKTYSLF